VKKRFITFLKQGLSPEELALCVALGGVLAIFPIVGSTTLLCALVAWAARLNQPVIQTVNYMFYPVQILLLIPFYRMGECLFRAPHLPLSVHEVKRLIQSGMWNAFHVLWDTTIRAVVAWGIVAPLVAGLLYAILLPVFRRLNRSLLVQ
jgi:uncharacterized protein (DUF2062 family)